jgi:hypothetical protein
MSDELFTAQEAARRLGISTASLYFWLAQSDRGQFVVRGQPTTINYLQGGPKGQGRIKIEVGEVERLKELQRVRPRPVRERRPSKRLDHYPGIYVELGDPGD